MVVIRGALNYSNIIRLVTVTILIINFFFVSKIRFNYIDLILFLILIIYYVVFKQKVALNIIVLYLVSFYLYEENWVKIKNFLISPIVKLS